MYSNSKNYQTSLMSWTEPTTQKQKDYFSKHAPERKLFGWFLWALLGIWAIADYCGFQMLFTEHLPALERFKSIVTVAILLILHYSLFITTKTYWFATLDDKLAETEAEKAEAAKTDATPWIALAITLLMLFASREGSKAILSSMAPVATIATTSGADTDKSKKLESEKKMVDGDLAAIEALYSDRIKAAEKPHRDAIARYRRSLDNTPWNNKAKRATLLNQIKKEEKLRDEAGISLLAEKGVKQQNTMDRYESSVTLITTSHNSEVRSIESANALELQAEAQGKAAANRYSWLISVLLAGLFWGTCYRWAKINLKSGIRPKYTFTEFDKNGGSWALLKLAVGDAIKRQMFRFAGWLHRFLSKGTRELTVMDGRVNFVDPDDGQDDDDFNGSPTLPDGDHDDNVRRLYARRHDRKNATNAVVITAETPVITTVHSDRKARLAELLQLIQAYHGKWRNPQGGTNSNIINWLVKLWQETDAIVCDTPAEVLGEQLDRYYRVVELDYQLFSEPRPRDKKATA